MRTWIRTVGARGCGNCSEPIAKGALALEVTTAGTTLLRCRACAKANFHEEPPAELHPDAAVVVPAPTLPIEGLHSHRHQGFVTAGELARRGAAPRPRALAAREQRGDRALTERTRGGRMTPADREIVVGKLASLVSGPTMWLPAEQVVALVHEGVPVPKARAGRFKARSFTPAKVSMAERDLGYHFRSRMLERPWFTNVAIVAVFFFPDRRRVDTDNCMKLVMDAATKANVWRDDSQVTAHAAFIECDPTHPRTLVALCPTTSSLDRTVPMKARGLPSLPLAERMP